MDFNPLTRSQQDYAWAVEQMLHCPGLTPFEVSMLTELLTAAYVSLLDFDECRQKFMMLLPGPLMVVINKCRAAGIGKEWPENATQD